MQQVVFLVVRVLDALLVLLEPNQGRVVALEVRLLEAVGRGGGGGELVAKTARRRTARRAEVV